MANRYSYQFDYSFKPKMSQIEGFVSIGTGGLINCPDQSGLGTPSGLSGQTGLPRGLLPGQQSAGLPTGWVGGFSGTIGLLGAGVDGVARVATGSYVLKLSDDYVRLDSVQLSVFNNATAVDYIIQDHTVGLGNTIATGGMTAMVAGNNPKNSIFIKFVGPSALAQDLDRGAGFYVDIRVRDSLSGTQ